MSVINPRYPHWCRIIRKTVTDPMEDEDDFDPMAGYDPMGSDDETLNAENEHQQESENNPEETSTEENAREGTQETVIYEGDCRSYKINTTSDRGEVITSQRGLALPLNQDGWDALGVVPKEGDEVVVFHGDTHKEYGRVIDKNVANASFAGTHLIWGYTRN